MKIREDLAIKYYLDLHSTPKQLDHLSVLFDLLQYLIKVKGSSQESLRFSTKTLKYVYGDRLSDETFKSELVKYIKKLAAEDFLTVNGETFNITSKAIRTFYTET